MLGLDDGVKTVTESIQDQTKTVTDLSTKQSKAKQRRSRNISKTFRRLNGLRMKRLPTNKFAKAFADSGNNGLTNSNEQLKTSAVITHAPEERSTP